MTFLDDRRTHGKPDIVDFVPFNAHQNNIASLTGATLNEIPGQLEGYFRRRGVMPLPPVKHNENDIYVEAADNSNLSFDFSGTDGVIRVSGGGNNFQPNMAYGNPNAGAYNPSMVPGMQNQHQPPVPSGPSAPGMTNQPYGGMNNMQPNQNAGAYNPSMVPGMQNQHQPPVPSGPSAPGMTNQPYGGMNNMQPNQNAGAYNPSMVPGMQNQQQPYGNAYGNRGLDNSNQTPP